MIVCATRQTQGYLSTGTGPAGIELGDAFPDYPDEHLLIGTQENFVAQWVVSSVVHGGYASRYEMDLFLKIEKGVMVSDRIVNNGTAEPDSPQGYRINATSIIWQEMK
jgi:hypothetical protein